MITSDWHASKGAIFEDFFGTQIPSHYGDYKTEYWNLRKAAALRDVSFFGKVRITGRDRQRFINSMVTNELKDRKPGDGIPAAFLDVKGHLQADMKFYVFPDHLLMVLQHYVRDKIVKGLDRYIISEDVQMTDVTNDYGMFQILGPQSEPWLQSHASGTLPVKLYGFSAITIGGRAAHAIRLGSGFALLTAASDTTAVLNSLDLPLVGFQAFDVFRVESGLPIILKDMDEANFPQEAGLNNFVNFQKGCYLGQEVMARIDAQGHVNRHLMGLAASAPIHRGDSIYAGNREIGRITSSVDSLLLGRPFGMGYVRREFAVEGGNVEIGDDRITSIVRKLPLSPNGGPS
jgi:folate-binding protein YgfZ